MLINRVNSVSFGGKIIEAHAHTGQWYEHSQGKPVNYTLNDIFERADKVQNDGDEITKVIVSNLDALREENGKPVLDEIQGNKVTLTECKANSRAAALAVCQPKTGDVKNIKKLFKENPNGFVGLKFHPLNANFAASDEKYVPYLKFAQEKRLPCLFHSQVNVTDDEGRLIADNINVSDPELIYKAAKKAPKAPVILGHMGAGWNESHHKAVDILIQSIEKDDANLYADISWVDFNDPKKPNLIKAIKRLMHTSKGDKTDRLLFGTDVPIAEYAQDKDLYPRIVRETKAAIRANFGEKSDELIEKIFYKNADNLFFQNKNFKKNMFSKTTWSLIALGVLTALFTIGTALKSKLSEPSLKK